MGGFFGRGDGCLSRGLGSLRFGQLDGGGGGSFPLLGLSAGLVGNDRDPRLIRDLGLELSGQVGTGCLGRSQSEDAGADLAPVIETSDSSSGEDSEDHERGDDGESEAKWRGRLQCSDPFGVGSRSAPIDASWSITSS